MFTALSARFTAPVLAVHVESGICRALLHVPGGTRPHALPDAPHPDSPAPDAALLRRLCAAQGLPEPRTILYAPEPAGEGALQAAERTRRLGALFGEMPENGLPLCAAPDAAHAPALLRLEPIRSMTECLAADAFAALAAGMGAQPGPLARSRREGVVLLHMGRRSIRAALLFRERIFSALELPARALFPEHGATGAPAPAEKSGLSALLRLLDDFRLGWLPRETARAYGGNVYSAPQLPAEAEGFRPAFLYGPLAPSAAGHGIPSAAGEAGGAPACNGLLYGYACGTAD